MRKPATAAQHGTKRPLELGVWPAAHTAGQDGLDRPVVAVANRLPVQRGDDGWELSPGGLVTALRPVMSAHPGAWVGWDGGTKGMPSTLPDSGIRLLPIGLSAAQVRNYYHGFAN